MVPGTVNAVPRNTAVEQRFAAVSRWIGFTVFCQLLAVWPAYAGHGSIDSDVTPDTLSSTVCVSGYTKSVRPDAGYTNGIKLEMLREAGIGRSALSEYTLDHIIPLAIGGHPSDRSNLQLQTVEDAKRKDRVEVKLQCLVCSGQVGLEEAQQQIGEDWEAAYHHYAKLKCHRHSAGKHPHEDAKKHRG
jgi:hypothetical protein